MAHLHDSTLDTVRHALLRNPSPAATLSSLREASRQAGEPPLPEDGILLRVLRERPEEFQVVDVAPAARVPHVPRRWRRRGPESRPVTEPWVVDRRAGAEGGSGRSGRRAALRILAECIRHLSLHVDSGSAVAYSRWSRMAREAEALPLNPSR